MSVGVFIPIGNNGWLLSQNAPQYKPSFELNKQIVLKAEGYEFDIQAMFDRVHHPARGRRGAKVAGLARNPNTFLSAVQIGVTVAGFASAAYGATSIAPSVAPLFVGWGMSTSAALTLATTVLTLVIAYLSLVLGELVPKRLAIQRNAQFAYAVAPVLDGFATVMKPVIWLLSVSTNALVRLLGGDPLPHQCRVEGVVGVGDQVGDQAVPGVGIGAGDHRGRSDTGQTPPAPRETGSHPRHTHVGMLTVEPARSPRRRPTLTPCPALTPASSPRRPVGSWPPRSPPCDTRSVCPRPTPPTRRPRRSAPPPTCPPIRARRTSLTCGRSSS